MGIRIALTSVLEVILAAAGLIALYKFLQTKWGGDDLRENDPKGYYPGNRYIWWVIKFTFLPTFGYANWWEPKLPVIRKIINRRLELIGVDHIREALRWATRGVIVATDHRSSADVFMPQIILYLYGFRFLAEFVFFYVVGLRFLTFFRHIISVGVWSRDRVAVIPPTMIPTERPLVTDKAGRGWFVSQLRLARESIEAARKEAARLLGENRWMYIAPEGGRSDEVVMTEAQPATAELMNHDGAIILPVAHEGTEKMWPKGGWPKPLNRIKVIVGKPRRVEVIRIRARSLEANYKVSFNRAFVDVIMREIAKLHIYQGNPWYAGYYSQPLEEIYEKREE